MINSANSIRRDTEEDRVRLRGESRARFNYTSDLGAKWRTKDADKYEGRLCS